MTYYAIKEDEALVIRFILQGITSGAYALRSMAEECQKRFPRKNGVSWSHTHISGIITHPIYKGEFIANRLMKVKDENGKKRDVERPRDEWISVPVPAIVTPELWEQANRMLEMNKRTAPRNSKNEYLLTGLLICASCGYHWHGHIAIYKYKRKDGTRHAYKTPLYYCNSTNMLPHKRKQVACDQRKISCNVLDRAVWEIVSDVLTEPQYMLDALDRSLTSDINKEIEAQIDYIDRQFADKKREEEKLWAAYNADVFDVEEYQERLRLIKQGRETLKLERTALERKLITPEAVEAQKAMILNLCETAIVAGKLEDVPFEVKRQIIKLVVDEVVVDVRERTFELRGTLSGKFPIVSKSTAIPCPAP